MNPTRRFQPGDLGILELVLVNRQALDARPRNRNGQVDARTFSL